MFVVLFRCSQLIMIFFCAGFGVAKESHNLKLQSRVSHVISLVKTSVSSPTLASISVTNVGTGLQYSTSSLAKQVDALFQ